MSRADLVRVVAPHFVAGVLVNSELHIVVAAPILGWARGKHIAWLADYCKAKGWGVEAI